MMDNKEIKPVLFAQDHSNSNWDYMQEKYWEKINSTALFRLHWWPIWVTMALIQFI